MTRASNRNRLILFDRDERGSVANLRSSGRIENGRHSLKVAAAKRSRLGLQKASQDARTSDRTNLIKESFSLAKASREPKEPRSCSHDLMLAGLNALDVVDVGVVVADALGRLLLVNQVARQILGARDGIALSSSGMLEVVSASGCRPLRLPKECASTSGGDAWKNDTMEAVQRGSGRRPLTILVRSLDANRTNCEPVAPAFLIFMLDPERPVEATEATLHELYKFTAAEARLAKLLMSGRTFEQCCEQLGVRPSTIRMHLGNLFAKTGVQRQGQLVSLLLKSVGMVRTGGERSGFQQTAIDSRVGVQSESQVKSGEMFSASVEALHWLDMGIAVINSAGEVLFVNEQATRIFAARDGLELTTRGVLSAAKKGLPLAVNWSSCDPSEDVVMAVRRPSGKRALTLIIRSLSSSEHQCDVDKPRALVFVLDPETSAATESRLLQLFGLTASEARLARLLMDGRTIDDCCEPLDICPSTARRHLANIFAKTNVRHQGQLISLLLKSTGAVRARNDSVTGASPVRCVGMPGPWAVTNALGRFVPNFTKGQ